MRAVTVDDARGTPLYVVNDNGGELFEMCGFEGTVVVARPELYAERPALPASLVDRPPDLVGAIGAVRPTDVLILELHRLRRGQGDGALRRRRAPAARVPALWSFAELLRTSGALELDIDPRELDVGLQPYRSRDGTRSRRVFIADQLENGAGYAHRLGRPEVLERVLDRIVDELGPRLEGIRTRRVRQRVPRLPAELRQPPAAPDARLAPRARSRRPRRRPRASRGTLER